MIRIFLSGFYSAIRTEIEQDDVVFPTPPLPPTKIHLRFYFTISSIFWIVGASDSMNVTSLGDQLAISTFNFIYIVIMKNPGC